MKNQKGIIFKIVPLLYALALLCACTAQTQNALTGYKISSKIYFEQGVKL